MVVAAWLAAALGWAVVWATDPAPSPRSPVCTAEGELKGDELRPNELGQLGLQMPNGLREGGPSHFSPTSTVVSEDDAIVLANAACEEFGDNCAGWFLHDGPGPGGEWHIHFIQFEDDMEVKSDEDSVRSCINKPVIPDVPSCYIEGERFTGDQLKPNEIDGLGLTIPDTLVIVLNKTDSFEPSDQNITAVEALTLADKTCTDWGDNCVAWYIEIVGDHLDMHFLQTLDGLEVRDDDNSVRSCVATAVPIVSPTTMPSAITVTPCNVPGEKLEGDELKPNELGPLGVAIPNGLQEGGPSHFEPTNKDATEAEVLALAEAGCKELGVNCAGWFVHDAPGPKTEYHIHFIQFKDDMKVKTDIDSARSCMNEPVIPALNSTIVPSISPTASPTSSSEPDCSVQNEKFHGDKLEPDELDQLGLPMPDHVAIHLNETKNFVASNRSLSEQEVVHLAAETCDDFGDNCVAWYIQYEDGLWHMHFMQFADDLEIRSDDRSIRSCLNLILPTSMPVAEPTAPTVPGCTVAGEEFEGDELSPKELQKLGLDFPDYLKKGGPSHFEPTDTDTTYEETVALAVAGCEYFAGNCAGWYLHDKKGPKTEWHIHFMQFADDMAPEASSEEDVVRSCANAPVTTMAPVVAPTPVTTKSPVVAPTTPLTTEAPVVTPPPLTTEAPVVTPPPVAPTPSVTSSPSAPGGGVCFVEGEEFKGDELKPNELGPLGVPMPNGLQEGGPAHFTPIDENTTEQEAIALADAGCKALAENCAGWFIHDAPGPKNEWHIHFIQFADDIEIKDSGSHSHSSDDEGTFRSCLNSPVVTASPAAVLTNAPTSDIPSGPGCTVEGSKIDGDNLTPRELDMLSLTMPQGLMEGGPEHFKPVGPANEDEVLALANAACLSFGANCVGWYVHGGPGGPGGPPGPGPGPGPEDDWHIHFKQFGTDMRIKDDPEAIRSCINAPVATKMPSQAGKKDDSKTETFAVCGLTALVGKIKGKALGKWMKNLTACECFEICAIQNADAKGAISYPNKGKCMCMQSFKTSKKGFKLSGHKYRTFVYED